MAIGPVTQSIYSRRDTSTSTDREPSAKEKKRLPRLACEEEILKEKKARTFKPLLGEDPSNLLAIAAEKLQLTLRRPNQEDTDYIKMNLYSGVVGFQKNLTEEELDTLISRGTYTKKGHVHEMTLLEDASHDLVGAIHFDTLIEGTKQGEAHIHSLDVLPGNQGKGIGTLLLSSALEAIHARGGEKVTLKTTDEGVFLYAAFSFRPKKPSEIPQESWIELPYPIKVKVLTSYWEETPGRLLLDLTSDRVKEVVAKRFHTLFIKREKKPELDLEEINLPEEVFSWGILEDTRNHNESTLEGSYGTVRLYHT